MTTAPLHRVRPRVVVADDSPTLRKVVASVLTREGFDVVAVAEDGVGGRSGGEPAPAGRGRHGRADAAAVRATSPRGC